MAGPRPSRRRSLAESEEEERRRNKTRKKKQVVFFLDGSDDDGEDREANEDLTVEILEKAKRRMRGIEELEWVRISDSSNSSSIVDVSSSEGVEVIDEVAVADDNITLKRRRAKERRKTNKKTKKGEENEAAVVDGKLVVNEDMEIPKSAEAMADEVELTDNTVLRKLLRGPRYFDPPEDSWGSCYNCGEVGHAASNCLLKKQKKPCYICGKFGHAAKSCSEVRACFICKKIGHRAKKCSEKHNIETLRLCLRCGSPGHDMSSCRNDYDVDDLKEVQCYVCGQYGHLCCIDFVDTGPRVVSCYNCGQMGHTGLGCARHKSGKGSTLCYKCGEEGHLARGCNNHDQCNEELTEPLTPHYIPAEDADFLGFRSVPHDSGESRESQRLRYHEGAGLSGREFKRKNGWITNGGNSSARSVDLNEWGSPKTPIEKIQRNSGLRHHGSHSNYIPALRNSSFRSNGSCSSHTPGFREQWFSSDASTSWKPRQRARFERPSFSNSR